MVIFRRQIFSLRSRTVLRLRRLNIAAAEADAFSRKIPAATPSRELQPRLRFSWPDTPNDVTPEYAMQPRRPLFFRVAVLSVCLMSRRFSRYFLLSPRRPSPQPFSAPLSLLSSFIFFMLRHAFNDSFFTPLIPINTDYFTPSFDTDASSRLLRRYFFTIQAFRLLALCRYSQNASRAFTTPCAAMQRGFSGKFSPPDAQQITCIFSYRRDVVYFTPRHAAPMFRRLFCSFLRFRRFLSSFSRRAFSHRLSALSRRRYYRTADISFISPASSIADAAVK